MFGTACFTSSLELEVPFAPASLNQPSILSRASEAAVLICADCSTIPPSTRARMTATKATATEGAMAGSDMEGSFTTVCAEAVL